MAPSVGLTSQFAILTPQKASETLHMLYIQHIQIAIHMGLPYTLELCIEQYYFKLTILVIVIF